MVSPVPHMVLLNDSELGPGSRSHSLKEGLFSKPATTGVIAHILRPTTFFDGVPSPELLLCYPFTYGWALFKIRPPCC